MPWASNPFSFYMLGMTSHLSSSVSSSYVNPSFGSWGMMPPYSPFVFGGGHIPQPTPMVGGWNPPSYGTNPSFSFPGSSTQMVGPSNSYIRSIYLYFILHVPMNTFLMENLPLFSGVSFRGS